MALEDDPVDRIADIAMKAVSRALVSCGPAIRREIAIAIHTEFGGEMTYIGKGTALRHQQRNQAIRADRATGLSLRALARKYDISKTQVANMLKSDE